jgi:hypothetical protein
MSYLQLASDLDEPFWRTGFVCFVFNLKPNLSFFAYKKQRTNHETD